MIFIYIIIAIIAIAGTNYYFYKTGIDRGIDAGIETTVKTLDIQTLEIMKKALLKQESKRDNKEK
jgi:hypothetical protein